jgi:regulator of replication initiation timing
MIDRLRAEQARTLEDNQRLAREMDALRARMADAQGASAEVEALREERELIRSRVVEMLQRIEALNL